MNKYLKYGIFAVAFIVAFGLIASLQFEKTTDNSAALPKLKEQAPDFTLRNIDGKTVSLKDFKGKTVYIKFWASWCKDCIKEVIPQRKLEETADNVVFLNVSVDENEDAWKKAVLRNKLTAEELISNDGDEENINSNYGISEIPRYIIIGKNGEVLNNNAPHPSETDKNYFAQYN